MSGGGTSTTIVSSPQQNKYFDMLYDFANPMINKLEAFATGTPQRQIIGYESVWQPWQPAEFANPLINNPEITPYGWDAGGGPYSNTRKGRYRDWGWGDAGGHAGGQYVQKPIYSPAQNVTSLYDIPAMPQLPGAIPTQGLYTGVPQYNISSYSPTGYDIPGLSNMRGWQIGDYKTMMAYVPGAYSPKTYDVGRYNLPNYQMMMPSTGVMSNISPDVRAAVMAPYKETSEQVGEQLARYGGASARAGASGSMAAGLGRYWGDVAPEYTQSLWGMVQPALQMRYQAELGRNQALWGAELAQRAQYARDINQARQQAWQAQVEAQNTYAAQENARRAAMASQQTARAQQLAMSDYERRQLLQGQQLAQNQYLAGLTNAERLRMAEEQTARAKYQQGLGIEEARLGYEQDMARQQQQRDAEMLYWQQQLAQQQMPWNFLAGAVGGMPAGLPTPVIQEEAPNPLASMLPMAAMLGLQLL